MASEVVAKAGGKHICKSTLGAGRLGGTIRIHEHVDTNLQTEYANLYVCDGSVIPQNTHAPVLTLVCLGKHLAKHLSRANTN
jgi:hypothetical protein